MKVEDLGGIKASVCLGKVLHATTTPAGRYWQRSRLYLPLDVLRSLEVSVPGETVALSYEDNGNTRIALVQAWCAVSSAENLCFDPLVTFQASSVPLEASTIWSLKMEPSVAASVVLRLEDETGTKLLSRGRWMNEALAVSLRGRCLMKGVCMEGPGSTLLQARVTSTVPSYGLVRVDVRTRFTFDSSDKESKVSIVEREEVRKTQTLELQRLLDFVLQPLRARKSMGDAFPRLLEPPRGILLHGPPGVGKTRAMRELLKACKKITSHVLCRTIQGVESGLGDMEAELRGLFEEARNFIKGGTKEQPKVCVLFFDEIEVLFPKRDDSDSNDSKLVAQMLTLMDGVASKGVTPDGYLVVIGATNQVNNVDPALRRPGRFERELEFPPPSLQERISIINMLLDRSNIQHLEPEVVAKIAEDCVGYVGADLELLVREAILLAMQDVAQEEKALALTARHFGTARSKVGVAASLRASSKISSTKKVSWDDIGGLKDVKQVLRQTVEWPILHKDEMKRIGVKPIRGILLHGPPGCSKTNLVRAAVNASKCSFQSLSGADIFSPWVGDSELAIRKVFRRARNALPSILFLDELDTIVGKRGLEGQDLGGGQAVQARVLSTLLNEMDGVEGSEGLLVIGATNRLDMIDEALLRPGRFDKVIHVPIPRSNEERLEILDISSRSMPISSDVNLVALASKLQGRSGAEIRALCQEAAIRALREDVQATYIRATHFDQVFKDQKREHF